MAAVATQYAQWLNASAAQAAGAAAQANATAAIFETAKAAIAHPAAVTGNRMQLLSLVRSNLFGFNAPAIAATEGAYESMWAQNVAALSGYHGAASAVAAQLTPWGQVTSLGDAVLQIVSHPQAIVPVERVRTIAKVLPPKMLADGVQLGAENAPAVAAIKHTTVSGLTAAAGDLARGDVLSAAQGVSRVMATDTGSVLAIGANDVNFVGQATNDAVAIVTGTAPTPTPPPPAT
jgi:PPE-repeat protein